MQGTTFCSLLFSNLGNGLRQMNIGSRSERDTHCHTTHVTGVQCRWERQPNVQTHTFAFQQELKFSSKRNSSTIQPLWQKQGRTIERVDFERVHTMNPAGFILPSSFTSRWLLTTNKNIFTKPIKGINTVLFMSILLLRCLYKNIRFSSSSGCINSKDGLINEL